MKNNNEMYTFFSKFVALVIIIIVFMALFGLVFTDKNDDVEPLSINEQQRIVMQLGIQGYKVLSKNNCYQALVVRIRTDRWNDQYCAKSYMHLDFAKIKKAE